MIGLVHPADGSQTPDLAWKYREGRRRRYEDGRVGGTVVVHFIKKNMWFLETAAALLQGDDMTPLERALDESHDQEQEEEQPDPSESAGGDEDADVSQPPVDADPTSPAATDTGSESTSTISDSASTETLTNTRTMIRRARKH